MWYTVLMHAHACVPPNAPWFVHGHFSPDPLVQVRGDHTTSGQSKMAPSLPMHALRYTSKILAKNVWIKAWIIPYVIYTFVYPKDLRYNFQKRTSANCKSMQIPWSAERQWPRNTLRSADGQRLPQNPRPHGDIFHAKMMLVRTINAPTLAVLSNKYAELNSIIATAKGTAQLKLSKLLHS